MLELEQWNFIKILTVEIATKLIETSKIIFSQNIKNDKLLITPANTRLGQDRKPEEDQNGLKLFVFFF